MDTLVLDSTSTQYLRPTWNGVEFEEEIAQTLWNSFPSNLRNIAIEEMGKGNEVVSILENRGREIVLLEFSRGPSINLEIVGVSTKMHASHKCGNYCYDGTKATIEDIETGFFLCFNDPNFRDDAI